MAGALAAASSLEVPFFRQEKNGCGAASVAMVAHYWSPATAPAHTEIYDALIDPERKGIPMARMKEYLERIGFRAYAIRGQRADIEQHLAKGRPLIVTLQDRRTRRVHFAVLTGVEGEHVWLHDPTRKEAHRTARNGFEKQWRAAGSWLLLATP
jgi:predicted double-glycine peptidase